MATKVARYHDKKILQTETSSEAQLQSESEEIISVLKKDIIAFVTSSHDSYEKCYADCIKAISEIKKKERRLEFIEKQLEVEREKRMESDKRAEIYKSKTSTPNPQLDELIRKSSERMERLRNSRQKMIDDELNKDDDEFKTYQKKWAC